MNGISIDNLLASQAYKTVANTAAAKSTAGSSFASLLSTQMNTQQGITGNAVSSSSSSYMYPTTGILQNAMTNALTGNGSGSTDTKSMIMMLCLMMCANSSANGDGGSGMSTIMASLAKAFAGASGTDASSGTGTVNTVAAGSSNYITNTSLPANTKGAAIVQAALTRLGDPYSKSKRGQGDYVDCSSLAQWAYAQQGITIPSTSVAQAKYCYDNGYTITKDQLQPGDLVFWSKNSCDCGRWHEIHHVGIYAGDNKVVEAKTSTHGVVLDDLWEGGPWKIDMYARPGATSVA